MSATQALGISTAEAPYLRLPDAGRVFAERAERLTALAADHALADYLGFLATLAQAQQAAIDRMAAVPLPIQEQQRVCREHGLPVLGIHGWSRDAAWREALQVILATLRTAALPADARSVIDRLAAHEGEWERHADLVLASDFSLSGIDIAAAPFIAAALQVYWVHMATELGVAAFGRAEKDERCPVCGSPPVASVVRIGGAEQGLRYAVCALCAAEWNVVRVKCIHCESTKGISYYGIEGSDGAVKAEACEACKTYLKIMYMNKQPQVEATADDVASVALDVLMAEEGYARTGVNFFLLTTDQDPTDRNV